MIKQRQETSQIPKTQTIPAMPIKTLTKTPDTNELKNMNNNTITFDETNGVLYIKANNYIWKATGFTKVA
jgi:hypothetical protein